MSRNGYQTSQNCDNFISDRSSTRLHAPPGGSSQLSYLFGGGEAPAPQERQRGKGRPQSQQQDYFQQQQQQQHEAPVRRVEPVKREENPAQDVTFGSRSKFSSNSFANGANQNAGNVLTDRPTTRLHAPPGGKSSITFG